MELSAHRNHRNLKYLNWLRKQPCVVSGKKAECAHHIRLGTNGGTSLKPSDYFCIPLLNEFHTTGSSALHIIGEETFLNHFKLDKSQLFLKYLSQYLLEVFDVHFQLSGSSDEELLEKIIALLEAKNLFVEKKKKPKTKSKTDSPKVSLTENDFYQKSKELKRVKDKELRDKLKKNKTVIKATSLKGTEFYENAKELKRARDKELRAKLKATKIKTKSSSTGSDFYEMAKEKKKAQEKEMRDKNKEHMSKYRKEQYRKMKESKAKASDNI
ncbi:hypothetical protein A9Q84_00665 [Halobacteriovorax marinus]|uniref:Uncharacterized protein n=1 Tax=Halobacteriovorax marinus TaxID=97084 RepID=A0A1Y5FH89_9BACT|nr:hypothetical protein A9Q84_00665 [Halobacteriovorax marinus]